MVDENNANQPASPITTTTITKPPLIPPDIAAARHTRINADLSALFHRSRAPPSSSSSSSYDAPPSLQGVGLYSHAADRTHTSPSNPQVKPIFLSPGGPNINHPHADKGEGKQRRTEPKCVRPLPEEIEALYNRVMGALAEEEERERERELWLENNNPWERFEGLGMPEMWVPPPPLTTPPPRSPWVADGDDGEKEEKEEGEVGKAETNMDINKEDESGGDKDGDVAMGDGAEGSRTGVGEAGKRSTSNIPETRKNNTNVHPIFIAASGRHPGDSKSRHMYDAERDPRRKSSTPSIISGIGESSSGKSSTVGGGDDKGGEFRSPMSVRSLGSKSTWFYDEKRDPRRRGR